MLYLEEMAELGFIQRWVSRRRNRFQLLSCIWLMGRGEICYTAPAERSVLCSNKVTSIFKCPLELDLSQLSGFKDSFCCAFVLKYVLLFFHTSV